MTVFESINWAYNSVFKPDELSVGIVVPVERYAKSPIPTMKHHLKRVQLIEQLGFKAIWLRDIPFHVPSFGDAGQTYDPFTYLGYLAGQTSRIALGISSIALPLHHPVHVAKSAATIDQLSDGRMILGVASGDRYNEYPAMGINYEKRGELFRESFEIIRNAQNKFPKIASQYYGNTNGQIDILPKPTAQKIPMLMTGYSRQSLEWNAANADGWMSYPKNLYQQQNLISEWRTLVAQTASHNKPFMQPLYIDLTEKADFAPQPIHLGLRLGVEYLIEYLNHLKSVGVNHIAFNLRFNNRNIEETLEQIAKYVLPQFHSNN